MEELLTVLISIISFLAGMVIKNCVDVATLKLRVTRIEEILKDGN